MVLDLPMEGAPGFVSDLRAGTNAATSLVPARTTRTSEPQTAAGLLFGQHKQPPARRPVGDFSRPEGIAAGSAARGTRHCCLTNKGYPGEVANQPQRLPLSAQSGSRGRLRRLLARSATTLPPASGPSGAARPSGSRRRPRAGLWIGRDASVRSSARLTVARGTSGSPDVPVASPRRGRVPAAGAGPDRRQTHGRPATRAPRNTSGSLRWIRNAGLSAELHRSVSSRPAMRLAPVTGSARPLSACREPTRPRLS
jgi:hypothetical protein